MYYSDQVSRPLPHSHGSLGHFNRTVFVNIVSNSFVVPVTKSQNKHPLEAEFPAQLHENFNLM